VVGVTALLSGAVLSAAAAPASAAPPVRGCPPGFDRVSVAFVVAGAGLDAPDPSMDPNGDGFTCLKLIPTGKPASGGTVTRASWHDNTFPG
jgi:hypothetical protein